MLPSDNTINVSLVRELAKCRGPDGPIHFLLDFDQCNSPQAVEYVGEVLKDNFTITWLEVNFRYHLVPVECMTNLFQSVSHHPHLKVLEVRIGESANRTPSSLLGYVDEVMRLFLLAAAQNGKIEKVKLLGRPALHVTEIFKFIDKTSNIKELELVNFPDTVVGAWPPNTSITTLRLKPAKSERYRNPLNPDGHPGLTGVLDLLSESSSRGSGIKHLEIREWSWSLSKYLQSPNSSVESLHLSGVNFRHDRFTGFSPINVFVFGIQGSTTTTELCFENCTLDQRGISKLLKELNNDTLGLKVLKFKNTELEGEHIKQFLQCKSLERLEFDEGNLAVIDKSMYCINEGVSNCAVEFLRIPVDSIASLVPSLKIAVTERYLTHLELTDTQLDEVDVECLTSLLEDEKCKLRHLSLEFLCGLEHNIMMALEGESKIESLRLKDVTGQFLPSMVHILVDSLANMRTLKKLTIVCSDLTPKMEHRLAEALAANNSLESVVFERLVFEAAKGTGASAHQCEPVISLPFRSRLQEIMVRNTGKRKSKVTTSSPNSVINGPGSRMGLLDELPIG